MDNNNTNPEQQPQQPAAQPYQPAPSPQPVASPVQPQIPVAPAPAFPQATGPMSQAPKKSLLWLWISLAVVVIVVVGLVVGFFMAKSNADKVASDYTTSAKSYLGDVYDAASGSASDPADINDDVKDIDKPQLKKVFLSSASSKYADAEKLSKDIDSKVADFGKKIDAITNFEKFYKQNQDINQSVSTIVSTGMTAQNASSLLKQVGAKLDEFHKLIQDTDFPSELADKKPALETAAKTCVTAWHSMEAAFDARDQGAYTSAYNSYKDCITPLETAAQPFNDYHDNLASKVRDAAKDLQDFQDSVDTDEA